MNYKRLIYKTLDGSMNIEFVFMDCGERIGWRVYIISDIEYGEQDASGPATHRNHFPGDTYKCICWTRKINTLDEAKTIAALWSDVTSCYIKNGGSFDSIASSLIKK